MGFSQEQQVGSCENCKQVTMHIGKRETVNHILHLLLTLFLCGFWLPVWLIAAFMVHMSKTEWQCTRCGHRIYN